MHFLITNDDGYGSAGILALEKALLPLGRVTVVAPDRHLSGCSHQVTTDLPLEIQQHGENHYAINGMPADCARVGLLHLAPGCDWLISGINEGANLGCDLYYSGTVAAAREAVLLGRPAIALSQYHTAQRSIDWEAAMGISGKIIGDLLMKTPVGPLLWNINLPTSDCLHKHTPVRYCPIDTNRLDIAYQVHNGTLKYEHGRYHERPRNSGSDVDVCFNGQIAISQVPLYGHDS